MKKDERDYEHDHEHDFAHAVIAWQRTHGRHALPWQGTRDAYRVWLSEIMLQQTQVSAVIPYYARFLARFPDIGALAAAPADDVMACWSGLGYYSRARNLHRCAQQVVAEYGGVFPADPARLAELPGIGRSTAAAISAFAYGTRAAILDGNVKRVLARAFGIERYPGLKVVENAMWQMAEDLLPQDGIEAYTQGLMDLGATVCTRTRPDCKACPLAARCVALASERTHVLPVPKPKKAVPHKAATLLLIVDGGEVLLERRPPSGIWGGLYSLPELDGHQSGGDPFAEADQGALEQAVARYGRFGSSVRLPTFSHVFTHFKLHATPYRITLAGRHTLAAEGQWAWFGPDALAQAGLPAPVRTLLQDELSVFGRV